MSLSLENRVLLSLIAKTSFGKDVPFLENGENENGINWENVYKESVQQTVMLFAAGAITPYSSLIPKEVFGKWLAHSSKTIANNMAVMNYQSELTAFLSKSNYKYVILKGLASSSYYENPDMRMLGDVDFLIENEKSDEIASGIQNNLGYSVYGMETHERHLTMTRNRDTIEMHFQIPGVPLGEKGNFVTDYISDILNDTKTLTIDGNSFAAPSDIHHGIIILLHMLHHMGEGLGLRHLCDWGAFVNKTADMDLWNDFVSFLRKLGLLKYASVMASVCHKYMGIDIPSDLLINDDALCEAVMCDVLHSGNFGNKDETYHQSSLLISQNGKKNTKSSTFSVLTGKLDSAVKLHWPWLKRWKILLPFAYVLFTVRYYFKVARGERPSLTALMPEANRRKDLYKELEIYEDEK